MTVSFSDWWTPLASTRPDHLALELSEPTKDRQHQAPVRGRGVRPLVAQRLEPGAAPLLFDAADTF